MADELLASYQHVINELRMITSSGGAYEITVNGELIFSKKNIQMRHAEPGEVFKLFADIVGPDVLRYPETK